jgi:hypothetical protein
MVDGVSFLLVGFGMIPRSDDLVEVAREEGP